MKKIKKTLLIVTVLLLSANIYANCRINSLSTNNTFVNEYVSWLKNGNSLQVEITTINPATGIGSHYYTSWGKGKGELLGNGVVLSKVAIAFSDRNNFKGKKDSSSYYFNADDNSLTTQSHTWGNKKQTYTSFKKVKNTIYYIDIKGRMMVFNFKKIKGKPSKKLTITPRKLTNLCPHAQVGGDYEFGGNGPTIKGNITLNTNADRTKIEAIIAFNAKETKSDWSEVEGLWIKTVYTAPAGKKIKAITSKQKSFFNTTLRGGGRIEFGPFGGNKDGGVHTLLKTNSLLTANGPVKKMQVVGDTGGWDISTDNNCANDTRIVAIEFDRITIELED